MREGPLYSVGDKVTSIMKIEGVVKDHYFNEESGEWVYICENILIKQSNIKSYESSNKASNTRKKKG